MKTRINSPLRYPGGKYYALKYLKPFWEEIEHDEFREPFAGGASVFFGKPKVQHNWLNDVDKRVIDIFKGIQDANIREQLIPLFLEETAIDRSRHEEIKQMKPEDFVERVFKFYFLNRTSFSGIIHKPAWGFKKGHSALPPTWVKRVTDAGEKLQGVSLTTHDFEDVIMSPAQGESVLLYVDPPYFHADQKRAYKHSFEKEDHLRLAKVLKATPHKFFLSYDDCEEIRELYSWAYIYERTWWYNIANCKGENSRNKGNELIITNYPMSFETQEKLLVCEN